jgi:hypothetical protein
MLAGSILGSWQRLPHFASRQTKKSFNQQAVLQSTEASLLNARRKAYASAAEIAWSGSIW